MNIGISTGYWVREPTDAVPLVLEAERCGFDSVWTSETWGSDALTCLTWLAAHTQRIGLGTGIMQMPGRTPAAAAMGAMTIDHLSGGRFRLGLGMSGPQVVEGWHGVPYQRPLEYTREYVEIVRRIRKRDGPVTFNGRHFHLPAEGGEGLGVPLRANVVPLRTELPIYLAAIGPRNVALAAEIADGWIPTLYSPMRTETFAPSIQEGLERSGREVGAFSISPLVYVDIGPDLKACRDRIRETIAFYVGGMGARGANFYNSLVRRYGFDSAAEHAQDLFLSGQRSAATAAIPDQLVDEVSLVGPVDRVRAQLEVWRGSGISTLIANVSDVDTVRALAQAAS